MRKLEVIALTLDDAVSAQAGGATGVEIVENLTVGGLTPSLEVVRVIRDRVTIHTRVIVRPHARSFVYSTKDTDEILSYVGELVKIGVGGVVFGALRDDSTINVPLVQQVSRAAIPLEVTLHRAIDTCREPEAALTQLVGIVQRVLTSGQCQSVWEGRETIRRWIAQHGASFTFACGGGIRAGQLPALVKAIAAPEYHVGTAARVDGVVDPAMVRALVEAING
jgi:copper homeostasis protein